MSQTWTPRTPERDAAAERARLMRGEWLVLISKDAVTVTDLLLEATKPEGIPLRRLKLRQVLEAQEGWGRASAREFLRRVVGTLMLENVDIDSLTVSWLLDGKTQGTRVQAWLDAAQPREVTLWPGFPFTPPPAAPAQRKAAA